jgi:hypothetical protein
MKTLIIGKGEIGKSVNEVLSPHFETLILDKEPTLDEGFEVLHICFPYSKAFEMYVTEYILRYHPRIVSIHSTVAPKTTESLQKRFPNLHIFHTPVEGKHPNLAKSIRAFIKLIGYCEGHKLEALELAYYYSKCGVFSEIVENPTNTEVGKILSTTKLGIDVIVARMFGRICKEYGADYEEAVKNYTMMYNGGYQDMGESQYTRPVLYASEEPIGGHCVKPNLELLQDKHMHTLKQFIISNETYGT